MQVAVDPDEGLLYQILRPLPVADGPVDEVDQPIVVPVHKDSEGSLLPFQKPLHDRAVVQFPEGVPGLVGRPRGRH